MSLEVDSFSSTLSLSQLLFPLIKHIYKREGDSKRYTIHKVQLHKVQLVRGGPVRLFITIKGGSRRAEKSRKVLMMMKAGVGRIRGRAGADHEQARSRLGAC